MGFAHDLPYALAKMKAPYGIRCPCNPNARTPSHPRQWQSPLFRRDFNATPGTASPNESMEIAVLGRAHMPSSVRTLSFSARCVFAPRAVDRKPVVFHARRNIEMVQAPFQMLGR